MILLLALSLCLVAVSGNVLRELGTNETGVERSYLRTNVLIEQRTEMGRMVLLICWRKRSCQRSRSTIPQWVRDLNEQKDYSGAELIHYHFYIMGQALPFMNSTVQYPNPALVYIIAQTPHFFDGDVGSKQDVSMWLLGLDTVKTVQPKDSNEIDQLLSLTEEAGNCTAKFGYMEHGVIPVSIQTPLDAESSVVLFKRLPLLDEAQCRHLILLYQDSYSMPLDDYSPIMVSETIGQLLPRAVDDGFDSCSAILEGLWFPIRIPLTELELIFFSGEHDLVQLEFKRAYIVIGIAGGFAVCALGISIFWGLNGSAFAK